MFRNKYGVKGSMGGSEGWGTRVHWGEEEDNEHNDTRQKLLGKGNGGGGVKRI
jgi:hypothetical protein